jgi:Flp pilus assembly protein TadD
MLAKNESRDQEAESWFQRAKTVAPAEPTVYVHYGLYLMDRNRFSEAAKNLGEAARLNPSNYDNVFNAAVAYREAGQLDIAEMFYRRTVEIRPMEAASHMNLGALLHLQGKLAEAEEEYIQAWTLRPGDQATRINIQRLHNIMKSRNLTTQELNL